MTKEKEFEILKEKVIKNSIVHIKLLKDFGHGDVKSFHKSISLLDAYIALVSANAEFRLFLSEHKN